MTAASFFKQLVGSAASSTFAPDAYWEQRHRTFCTSHEAVGHIGLSAQANATQYATKRKLILDTIDRHLSVDRHTTLLDAGCGIGLLTQHFVEAGFRVVGADFCAGAIERAKADGGTAEFIVSPLSSLDLGRRFEVVVVADVLLHVVDDVEWRRTLAALTRHLSPHGIFVILDWFDEDTEGLGEHVRPRAIHRYHETLDELGYKVAEHTQFNLEHENATKDLLVVRRGHS